VYQNCRWYDEYSQLAIVLRIICWMPSSEQMWLGEQLGDYLSTRHVPVREISADLKGNRWYDPIEPLANNLERMRLVPAPMMHQTVHFLNQLLNA
jgi:hypothetical protein